MEIDNASYWYDNISDDEFAIVFKIDDVALLLKSKVWFDEEFSEKSLDDFLKALKQDILTIKEYKQGEQTKESQKELIDKLGVHTYGIRTTLWKYTRNKDKEDS